MLPNKIVRVLAVWQHEYLEPNGINARYASVLTTAGGLLFTGDISGNLIAFDARTERSRR